MESSPASSFEVVEADLLLHLLVVAFDTPPELRKPDELLERRVARERREPELGGLCLVQGPLVHEPLLLAGRLPLKMVMRAAHAHTAKGGLLPAARSFAPCDGPACLPAASHRQLRGGHRLLLAGLPPRGRFPGLAPWAHRRRWDRRSARCPEHLHSVDPDDIGQPSRGEPITVVRHISVTGIGEDDAPSEAPRDRRVDLRKGDLPLLLEGNVVGDAYLPA